MHQRSIKAVKSVSRRAAASAPVVDEKVTVTKDGETHEYFAEGTSAEDVFAEGLEALSEKRYSLRQEGLKKMLAAMRSRCLTDTIEPSLASVTDALLDSVRKGKPLESELASEALALVIITAGQRQESVLARVKEVIDTFLTRSKSPSSSAAALKAYGIAGLVCGVERESLVAALGVAERIFCARRMAHQVRAQALNMWCMIVSRFSSDRRAILDRIIPRYLPVFRALLEHPNLSVRLAAGECVALVFGSRWAFVDPSEASTERTFAREEDTAAEEGSEAATPVADEADVAEAGAGAGAGAGAVGGGGDDAEDDDGEGYYTDEDSYHEGGFGKRDEGLVDHAEDGEDDASDVEEEEDSDDDDGTTPWDWRAVAGFEPAVGVATAGGTVAAGALGSVLSFDDDYDQAAMEQELHDLLFDLANDGGRRRSKRDKKTQRMQFRDYYAGFADGFFPTSSIRVRTLTIDLEGWASRVQFEHLKSCIASGMQVHLVGNPLLQAFFSYSTDSLDGPVEKMSATAKRMFLSPNSYAVKYRTADRAAGRSRKNRMRGQFGGEEV